MSTKMTSVASRWTLALVLALSAALAHAAGQAKRGETMRQQLAHGLLGLRWGMSAEQVMKAFPNAKKGGRPGRPLIAVNVAAGLWGARPKEDLFLLSVGADVSVRYSTKEASPLAPGTSAQVSVKRGPITESLIDEYRRLTSKPASQ